MERGIAFSLAITETGGVETQEMEKSEIVTLPQRLDSKQLCLYVQLHSDLFLFSNITQYYLITMVLM